MLIGHAGLILAGLRGQTLSLVLAQRAAVLIHDAFGDHVKDH